MVQTGAVWNVVAVPLNLVEGAGKSAVRGRPASLRFVVEVCKRSYWMEVLMPLCWHYFCCVLNTNFESSQYLMK